MTGRERVESRVAAVVLAAGRGRRLRPFTDAAPKCLFQVNGRPVLEYIFDAITAASIDTVFVVSNHMESRIAAWVDANAKPHLAVTMCHQPELSGTGPALLCVEPALRGLVPSPDLLLICAADYAVHTNYFLDLIGFHRSHECPLSVSLREVPTAVVRGSSLVETNLDCTLARIVEKPVAIPSGPLLAASLIYVVPLDIFRFVSATPRSSRGEIELPETINQMICAGLCARGFVQEPLDRLEDMAVSDPSGLIQAAFRRRISRAPVWIPKRARARRHPRHTEGHQSPLPLAPSRTRERGRDVSLRSRIESPSGSVETQPRRKICEPFR
jgi:glucose-1-phosphate thymidylyltransferase